MREIGAWRERGQGQSLEGCRDPRAQSCSSAFQGPKHWLTFALAPKVNHFSITITSLFRSSCTLRESAAYKRAPCSEHTASKGPRQSRSQSVNPRKALPSSARPLLCHSSAAPPSSLSFIRCPSLFAVIHPLPLPLPRLSHGVFLTVGWVHFLLSPLGCGLSGTEAMTAGFSSISPELGITSPAQEVWTSACY